LALKGKRAKISENRKPLDKNRWEKTQKIWNHGKGGPKGKKTNRVS